MVRGRSIRAVPVVAVFVIVAGMFAGPFIATSNIEVYGTVTDNRGNPLSNVSVTGYRTDFKYVTVAHTDTQGRFSLAINHYGDYEIWTQTFLDHYWRQGKKMTFTAKDNNQRHLVGFQLIPAVPCNVTLLAMYWSVNATHTYISFGHGFDRTGTIETLVQGFDERGPLNSTARLVTGRTGGEGFVEGGRVMTKPCLIIGHYSDAPGEATACYVEALGTGQEGLGLPAIDYLSVANASEGWTVVLPKNGSDELEIYPNQNYLLPDVLSVHVDVDGLGERFQTTLPCIMLAPDPENPLSIWVRVTNFDNSPHSYKFFVEGGHIIHIWEIS